MTKEECITQTLVTKLGMQVCILPREEEAVTVVLVVGWLVVTDRGGDVTATVCGDETTAEKRRKEGVPKTR